MVDWEAVERLRSKGWDWDRIVRDPRADFHHDANAGDPGHALRALYHQRRSTRRRRSGRPDDGGADASTEGKPAFWGRVTRIAYVAVPLLAIWFVLAFVFPSPVGTYLAAIPTIGLLLAIFGFLLSFGLLRTSERWTSTYRSAVVSGVMLGFVVPGMFGLAAITQGCPLLSPALTSEPGGWEKSSASLWSSNAAPVFFFYGSVACPYCSASSWAMTVALEKFGSLSGLSYGHSSSTDNYPNTPEVVLASATLQSRYVTLQVAEDTNDAQVADPPLGQCIEQAYVSAYDAGGLPFVVLGGIYLHSGTLVDPGQLDGMSASTVQQEIANQSGSAWTAVGPPAYYMMAFLVKLDHGQPTGLANDPLVQGDLNQIS
ncbi:MAG: DUF929 family protein [Thermoplasmata archaeon]